MLTSLRRQLRRTRSDLSASQQTAASCAVIARLLTLPVCHASQHIALYCPVRGEIDVTNLIEQLQDRHFYFPVMTASHGVMDFYPVQHQTELVPNRIGIPEPIPGNAPPVAPQQLDLAIFPLVAFDRAGHRLGAGGGFYDRYFAFTLNQPIESRPILLGVAYDFQMQEALSSTDTDVPLDGVITESALYIFTPKSEGGVNLFYANGSE